MQHIVFVTLIGKKKLIKYLIKLIFENRCNAAGILDLRNLAENNFEINDKSKIINSSFSENILNDENIQPSNYRKYPEMSPVLSSYTNRNKPSLGSSFDHITKDFKNLLTQYLSKSNYKNGIKADKIKEQFIKIIAKNANSKNKINKTENINKMLKNSNSRFKTTRPKISPVTTDDLYSNTKSILQIELLKKINKLSTKFSTKKMPTRMSKIASTTVDLPLLYKLKINDTISKSLLGDKSIRQKLGIKPNEHLNIVVKRPFDNDVTHFQVTSLPDETNIRNTQEFKSETKIDAQFSPLKYTENSKTLSWISKLKEKLNQVLSSTELPQQLNLLMKESPKPIETTTRISTTEQTVGPQNNIENDWSHILSENYRESIFLILFKLNF